jgi:hypothetical protein
MDVVVKKVQIYCDGEERILLNYSMSIRAWIQTLDPTIRNKLFNHLSFCGLSKNVVKIVKYKHLDLTLSEKMFSNFFEPTKKLPRGKGY